MGLASIAAKAVSKVANKAKDGIKNKLKNNGMDDEAKAKLKKLLILKVGVPLFAWIVIVGAVSVIMQQLFGDTNSSIKVTSEKIKSSIESGALQGDKDQINYAVDLEKQYGSCMAFTLSQIDTIYNETIKDLEGDSLYKQTYTSNYGSLTDDEKNDITNKYNEVKDKSEKSEKDMDIINYYNLSREGNFKMISPYDKRPIYKHVLMSEKYNFNNITWKAYYHNSDEVNDVSKDAMQYDTTYDLLYPKANANLKDMMNLVSPYLMTSKIPLAFLAGSMYSATNSNQSIGSSWLEQQANSEQGKNNEIGNFAYEIIKHGYSTIVMNQYNLESRTTSSYWLDYDIFDCADTYQIKKTIVTIDDGKGKSHKEARYSVINYKDGTENLPSTPSDHNNTRWDENKQPTPSKETAVGDPTYTIVTTYKLASALAFDVNISNSFDYKKYSNEDADKRENPDSVLSEAESEHKKIEDETSENHITLEKLNSYSQEELKKLMGDDGNTDTEWTSGIKYGTSYKYEVGKRHDITRYWSDSVSSQPSSQSKTLLSSSNVITFNKNEKSDPSMDTISDNDFNSDSDSKEYYEELASEEDTAINTIDILNSNPKIFTKYCDNTSKYAKYVGYSRADYTFSQGMQYLTNYLKEIESENNGTLPFVYGASFGFDVNATASSGISGSSSGLSLLREYINSWEPVNGYLRTESGSPTSNEDEAKYYEVFLDSMGVPTVGYGINVQAHFKKIADAMASASIEFPYTSAAEIKSKVSAGQLIMMDKSVIDSVQETMIQSFVDKVKAKTSGIELTEYQLFALTDRMYNGWNNINGKSFNQAYSEYWNQSNDDKYSVLYEKYKDNQGAKDSIISEIDLNHPLYVNFMKYTTGNAKDEAKNGGWTTRRKSEFILFSSGYFVGGYSMNQMLKFWTQATSPGNIQLIKADGSVDETACYNLQLWYEQNWFSNKFHAGTNMHVYKNCPTGGDNNDPLGALNPEMTQKYEPVAERNFRYQCAWWSCVRANMFLVDNNTGKYLYGTPNGNQVAATVASRLGLAYNTNIDNIKPNSLVSWTSSSSCGHTGYVEAVSGDYYITSECGSGKNWGGVIIHSKSADRGKFIGSVCLEDLVH